ncbi:carbonic anhydrase [Brevibacillus humidisoli]|uniref:beta-class carbonic anhydrase n=1 Tax=Brevibacillus humidisoli TaxID=2895522 RepID=UPI001E61396B|nr:carbonic anhydrase [Brevibacillus humidisoli]UFJ42898.1 carbonic anhydrase [Brevibacillus humidisoli]
MSRLYEIMEHNQQFLEQKGYERFQTTKFPDKGLVVLSCMDTRLVELLPNAMNLKNGDFKLIKNAGAIVSHPFGSIMRSILVAIYELNAKEVCVVGHHDCGMSAVNPDGMMEKMVEQGISEETIHVLENAGVDLRKWLKGFNHVADGVKNSVHMIRNHPLLPKRVAVHGLIIEPHTGKLEIVEDGYPHVSNR